MSNLPIIVGGFYRSGTTLVRRLLDAHSRIHCGPEIKFFKDYYSDYIDDSLGHIRFFKTARSIGLDEADLLNLFGGCFVEFHRRAARVHGKERWADKDPENVLRLADWQRLLPDGFVFLYVRRHPLDTLASLKEAGFFKTVPAEIEERCGLYGRFHEQATAYVGAHSTSSVVVHYEDIVAHPATAVRQIFETLGETFEPKVLEHFYAPERRSGIEDPKISSTRRIHSDSVGRWKRDLTLEEKRTAIALLPPSLFDCYEPPSLSQ